MLLEWHRSSIHHSSVGAITRVRLENIVVVVVAPANNSVEWQLGRNACTTEDAGGLFAPSAWYDGLDNASPSNWRGTSRQASAHNNVIDQNKREFSKQWSLFITKATVQYRVCALKAKKDAIPVPGPCGSHGIVGLGSSLRSQLVACSHLPCPMLSFADYLNN